eukprot:UN03173
MDVGTIGYHNKKEVVKRRCEKDKIIIKRLEKHAERKRSITRPRVKNEIKKNRGD